MPSALIFETAHQGGIPLVSSGSIATGQQFRPCPLCPESNRLPDRTGMANQGKKPDTLRCQLLRSSTRCGIERQSNSGSGCHDKPSLTSLAFGYPSSSCVSAARLASSLVAKRAGSGVSMRSVSRACEKAEFRTREKHSTVAWLFRTRVALKGRNQNEQFYPNQQNSRNNRKLSCPTEVR